MFMYSLVEQDKLETLRSYIIDLAASATISNIAPQSIRRILCSSDQHIFLWFGPDPVSSDIGTRVDYSQCREYLCWQSFRGLRFVRPSAGVRDVRRVRDREHRSSIDRIHKTGCSMHRKHTAVARHLIHLGTDAQLLRPAWTALQFETDQPAGPS